MIAEVLVAGLELDALIAEKIFGWNAEDAKRGSRKTAGHVVEIVDRYSTEIQAAWQVVEKMREIPCKEDNTASFFLSDRSNEWVCGYSWHDLEYGVASGESAPLAICLAALKAVEK